MKVAIVRCSFSRVAAQGVGKMLEVSYTSFSFAEVRSSLTTKQVVCVGALRILAS
jgi:hypothetical protein